MVKTTTPEVIPRAFYYPRRSRRKVERSGITEGVRVLTIVRGKAVNVCFINRLFIILLHVTVVLRFRCTAAQLIGFEVSKKTSGYCTTSYSRRTTTRQTMHHHRTAVSSKTKTYHVMHSKPIKRQNIYKGCYNILLSLMHLLHSLMSVVPIAIIHEQLANLLAIIVHVFFLILELHQTTKYNENIWGLIQLLNGNFHFIPLSFHKYPCQELCSPIDNCSHGFQYNL